MTKKTDKVQDEPSSNDDPKKRIKTICVLPLEKSKSNDPLESIRSLADFVLSKTEEYQKTVAESSAVLFTANVLQTRVVSWEFAPELAKVYEALGVRTTADYDARLRNMSEGADATEETKKLAERLSEAFAKWDALLQTVDVELERVVGPKVLSEVPTVKGGTHSTLKTLVEESSFDMTLVSVVASFRTPQSSQYALRVYESLPKFNQYGCDVLLLAKEDAAGGGFLKIVGVPFRQLMGEQEALGKLLKCGQYAGSLAGSSALHKFAEMTMNEEVSSLAECPLELRDAIKSPAENATMIISRTGDVLYSHVASEASDWPDIDVLLENVQQHSKPKKESVVVEKEKRTADAPKESLPAPKENPKSVESSKKRCCTIL